MKWLFRFRAKKNKKSQPRDIEIVSEGMHSFDAQNKARVN